MSRTPAIVEAQLTSAANAADRANRPRMLVLVPGLLLVGAVMLMVAASWRFSEAKADLRRRLIDAAEIQGYADAAMEIRSSTPDLESQYREMPGLADAIAREADAVWTESGSRAVTVKDRVKRPVNVVGGDGSLDRVDVDCTLTDVTLDDLHRWIRAVLDDPDRERVFLSRLDLKPRPKGWGGLVRFRIYENAE